MRMLFKHMAAAMLLAVPGAGIADDIDDALSALGTPGQGIDTMQNQYYQNFRRDKNETSGPSGGVFYDIYLPVSFESADAGVQCLGDGLNESANHVAFTVFLPPESAPSMDGTYPLVLHGHGFGASRVNGEMPLEIADNIRSGGTVGWDLVPILQNEGYIVISFDQRGFGESTGTVCLMDPALEGQRISAMVKWAEENLGDMLASDDDGLLLGTTGGSYGGGYQYELAKQDARLDAMVPEITWNSLITSLYQNQVVKSAWGGALVAAGESSSRGNMDPNVRGLFRNAIADNAFTEDQLDFLGQRGLGQRCAPVANEKLNVLMFQGMRDVLFPFNEAYANYQCLEGNVGDVRLFTYDFGHVLPGPGSAAIYGTDPGKYQCDDEASCQKSSQALRAIVECGDYGTTELIKAWFQAYLKGDPSTLDELNLPEICMSLGVRDAQNFTAVERGGKAHPFDPSEAQLGLGGSIPVAIPLTVISDTGAVLAGIPTAKITVDTIAASDIPGDKPFVLLGIGHLRASTTSLQGGGYGAWDLIDDQLTPVLANGAQQQIDLGGIAERLAPGDQLALLVYGYHPQYLLGLPRGSSTLIGPVSVSGSVNLPLGGGCPTNRGGPSDSNQGNGPQGRGNQDNCGQAAGRR